MFTTDLFKVMFRDAFEVNNSLGSAKQKKKTQSFSCLPHSGNLILHQRSTLDQIQLVQLCQEEDCKYFGVDKLFSKLVSDV